MKTFEQVSGSKLRGGFYSPDDLVDVCLDRAMTLIDGRSDLTVLEPSSGDGAFIRGLDRHSLGARVTSLEAVELVATEAAKSRDALAKAKIDGSVFEGSFLRYSTKRPADLAIGNPPFLRFQFVSASDQDAISKFSSDGKIPLGKVSNLWIPMFLKALLELAKGGVFAFIVPSEFLTGVSGRSVRSWLTYGTEQLQIDLFGPKSFPGVLQEVVIVSGRRRSDYASHTKIEVYDHILDERWTHVVDDTLPTWTTMLLHPEHVDALAYLSDVPELLRFGDVARMSVATVTGANGFFTASRSKVNTYGLSRWARPLLARSRHAPGLDFLASDSAQNIENDLPSVLIDFASGPPLPARGRVRDFLKYGEESNLHERYKCRIRNPWYQVPVVAPGTLMLSKRSHCYPRLIVNSADAVTTDTIYQGRPVGQFTGREHDIVGSFHNSFTLLSAEIFGRSFGGGVLELVPSEVAALSLPLVEITKSSFRMLDSIVRQQGPDSDELIAATDAVIVSNIPSLAGEVLESVRSARQLLLGRRLDRT